MRNRMAGILIFGLSTSGAVLLASQAARMAYGQQSEATSRSFTVTNVAMSDPPAIGQAFSRSITVTNAVVQDAPPITGAISRSITVTNAVVQDAPPITGAISRSITVCNVGNCAPDFNDDGQVGPYDLAVLLANWGCSDFCPGDLNCDGAVGVMDLNMLLVNWGPCT